MQRLRGKYQVRDPDIFQIDYQAGTTGLHSAIAGYSIPVDTPCSFVACAKGEAALYVSPPGEIPLYCTIKHGLLYWSEQKLDLPDCHGVRISPGELLIWNPLKIESWIATTLPLPDIYLGVQTIVEAIEEYKSLLLQAVLRRIQGRSRVAVATSGGIDSLLIVWALLQLGVEVVPLTVCTTDTDLDIRSATQTLETWGLKSIPVAITASSIEELIGEALLCYEEVETYNIRMAIGNLGMARYCYDRGIDCIFSGHGGDDIHGRGNFVKRVFGSVAGSTGFQTTLSRIHAGNIDENWRDTRRRVTGATDGMLKMFAATFRRYGVRVTHPYYDWQLLTWMFSRPTAIIPVDYEKSFAYLVAASVLPPGLWQEKKHSVGYPKGAGLALTQPLLRGCQPTIDNKNLRQLLKKIKCNRLN